MEHAYKKEGGRSDRVLASIGFIGTRRKFDRNLLYELSIYRV